MLPAIAFNDSKWQQHQNPDRYVRHFYTLSTSILVYRLGGSLLFLAAASSAVVAAHAWWGPMVSLPIDPFNLSATAVGLLLALRASESSGRVRKAQESLALIYSRLKDSARSFAGGLNQWEGRSACLNSCFAWLMAVGEAVKFQLRPKEDQDFFGDLLKVGLPEDAARRTADTSLPLCHLVSDLTQALQLLQTQGLLSDLAAQVIDFNLTDLLNEVASCEQMLRHPVPIRYTRHTSRVIWLWLLFVPFAFVQQLGIFTVPLVVLFGFGLLGIEDIAVQIEEPFRIINIEESLDRLAEYLSEQQQIARSTSALVESLNVSSPPKWWQALRFKRKVRRRLRKQAPTNDFVM